jgi:uncharacterized protein (TIGR03032 family)
VADAQTEQKPETQGAPPDAATPNAQAPARITCSRGMADWLIRHNTSLAFTSYQSGRLYLVGVDEKGAVSFHERFLARAMGLWSDGQRLLVSTIFQLWRFENILGPNERIDGADRHYVPRVAHTTGDIDIHEIGVLPDGRIVFVNTAHSCLATLSQTHSFKPFWKPPFISKLAPEDRCHLNGLGMRDGQPVYVTTVSRSDVVNGWRERRAEGGCIIDIRDNSIVTEKLSMPHSPRWIDGRLWVLNSGTGHMGTVDPASGAFEPVAFLPGFMRGFAIHKGFGVVGLSLPRNGTFTGLQLDNELKKRDASPWCGVQIVDLKNGDVVQWIRLEGAVSELFDIAMLPGIRKPTATGFLTNDIHTMITIEA